MSKRITDEDIEKGVAKVERMNALFDKMIFPVLLVIALAIFIFGALPKMRKGCKPEEPQPQEVISSADDEQTQPEENELYAKRNAYMLSMSDHVAELEEKGYNVMDIMDGMSGVRIALDEKTTVYEFCYGETCYGQIKQIGSDSFEQVSLTVIGGRQFNVALTENDGDKLYAKFDTPDFLPAQGDDEQQMILAYLTPGELSALRESYDKQLEKMME